MTHAAPCRIHHIDLTDRIAPLPNDDRSGSVMLVFWKGSVPLGRTVLDARELPLPPAIIARHAAVATAPAVAARLKPICKFSATGDDAEIANLLSLDRPLSQIVQRFRPEVGSCCAQEMSVIVCTRSRPVQLRNCLASLAAMDARPLEIIVVDNAPGPDTSSENVVREFPGTVYVAAPLPGLSIARNVGLRSAKGSILAFTDDDVIVHRKWTLALTEAFLVGNAAAITGLVLPTKLETDSQVAFEFAIGGLYKGCIPRTFDLAFFQSQLHQGVEVWNIGAGANMAFRRACLDAVGYFDERLGAGASGCSEDSEMWYRFLAAGLNCSYVPEAVVFHEHRTTRREFRRQVIYYMRGHVAALLVQYKRYGHVGNLRRAFWSLPKSLLRTALTALILRDWERLTLVLYEVSGSLTGLRVRYLKSFQPPLAPKEGRT